MSRAGNLGHGTFIVVLLGMAVGLGGGCDLLRVDVPLPSGMRQLAFDVVNDGFVPANLSITHNRLPRGAPVGSANPQVVAPQSRARVVFSVPLDDDWALFVNPTAADQPPVVAGADLAGCTGEQPIEVTLDPLRGAYVTLPPGWEGCR